MRHHKHPRSTQSITVVSAHWCLDKLTRYCSIAKRVMYNTIHWTMHLRTHLASHFASGSEDGDEVLAALDAMEADNSGECLLVF